MAPGPTRSRSDPRPGEASRSSSTGYACLRVNADHTIAANFVPTLVAGVEPLSMAAPAEVTLGPIQPNPMRDAARITFGLPVATRARLQILDVLGRAVADLADGPL